MSRVGKLAIVVPESVQVSINNLSISVKGPKGSISRTFKGNIELLYNGKHIKVIPKDKLKFTTSMWGTARSIISSMVVGVTTGFTKQIEINGVGYRANVNDSILNLSLGKSHNTKILIPKDIEIKVGKQNSIELSSFDKELLGKFTSLLKFQRKVEPYKGKGIYEKGQYIHRKEGKKG